MLKKLRLDLAARVFLGVAAIVISIALIQPGRTSQASCIMPTSGTVTGLTLVNDINACNSSLLSLFSGASAPSGPTTGMLWYNTTTNYIQEYDGSSWNNVWFVDATNHLTTPPIAGGSVGASLSSAATTDVGSVPQSFVTITGTVAVTSLGSSATIGTIHVVKFSGALLLTQNATSLILPGGSSITTSAGDIAFAMYLGAGNWQVLNYIKADGSSVKNPSLPIGSVVYGHFMTLPPKMAYGGGQALSRTTFPDYLAAVTRTQAMIRTSGNATLTGVADTSAMGLTMPVEGPGINTGCTILSVVPNTSITLNSSSCVTASGSASITVFGTGYGAGGDSTTVGVTNCRGAVMAGLDSMPVVGAANRLTSSFYGNAAQMNNFGGSESRNLAIGNINSFSFTPSVASASIGSSTIPVQGSFPFSGAASAGTAAIGVNNTGGFTIPVTFGSISIGMNAVNLGSGTAHETVQPTVTAQCVVVVLP